MVVINNVWEKSIWFLSFLILHLCYRNQASSVHDSEEEACLTKLRSSLLDTRLGQ